jgi:hypothetical protein
MKKLEIDYHTIINDIHLYVNEDDYCFNDAEGYDKKMCIIHNNTQLQYHPLSKNPHLICDKCLGDNED